MKRIILSLLLIVTTMISVSQTAEKPLVCGFDYFMKMKKQNDPHYYADYESLFSNWRTQKNMRGGGPGVYTVPVVFHIVYNADSLNIADSVVHSQLEVLNEDFRRLNENAIETRDIFLPFAADCEIEFQLASFDPEGNPTTGITHNLTDRPGFDLDIFAAESTLDEVKHNDTGGTDAWDPEHYVNIWVCMIEPTVIGQVFGISYPPAGLDNWPAGSAAQVSGNEGIIVHYTTVGRNNPEADADGTSFNNMGRTLTHEMGHYLGLRHTWGDDFFNICNEDDGIDDTPLCGSGDQYNCDYEANTCDDGTADDQPDMLENYMDYTKDECYNMFTNDQKSLMRYALEELRPGLLSGVGITETASTGQRLHLWPNPVSDQLNFSMAGINTPWFYAIYNSTGSLVQSGYLNHSALDVTNLEGGVYSIVLTGTGMSAPGRFIVK